MPVPIASTLGILSDNLRRRRSALPLSRRAQRAWSRGLDLPRGGETVLYTGQMWQMVPAINAMARQLAKYEDGGRERLFRWARAINRRVNLTPFLARSTPEERELFNARLRNIVRLLRAARVEFGYLYEDDLYTGALAYDEGLDEALVAHARFVAGRLKARGVRRAITVDPHTTNMLRSVYPRLLPGFDITVESYLEVLAAHPPAPVAAVPARATIHDSCIYARSEGVLEAPRMLLTKAGVALSEADQSGKMTFCCGGPLETLFPGKSAEIARRRLAQLSAASPRVITACPLCLANLSRVTTPDVEVNDISDYLVEAYCPEGTPG